MADTVNPVFWIGASHRDLRAMPQEVRRSFGKALYAAQHGLTDPAAKPLKGFGGTHVMEIVERFRTDAIVPSTRLISPTQSMCCTHSRRSRNVAGRRRSRKSI